jgi:hypothetical protein
MGLGGPDVRPSAKAVSLTGEGRSYLGGIGGYARPGEALTPDTYRRIPLIEPGT